MSTRGLPASQLLEQLPHRRRHPPQRPHQRRHPHPRLRRFFNSMRTTRSPHPRPRLRRLLLLNQRRHRHPRLRLRRHRHPRLRLRRLLLLNQQRHPHPRLRRLLLLNQLRHPHLRLRRLLNSMTAARRPHPLPAEEAGELPIRPPQPRQRFNFQQRVRRHPRSQQRLKLHPMVASADWALPSLYWAVSSAWSEVVEAHSSGSGIGEEELGCEHKRNSPSMLW